MIRLSGLMSRCTQPARAMYASPAATCRPERDQLHERERRLRLEQPAQRRALEVLDEQVRLRPVEHRVEAAQDHGVRERRERLGLQREVAARVLVRRRRAGAAPWPRRARSGRRPRRAPPRSGCRRPGSLRIVRPGAISSPSRQPQLDSPLTRGILAGALRRPTLPPRRGVAHGARRGRVGSMRIARPVPRRRARPALGRVAPRMRRRRPNDCARRRPGAHDPGQRARARPSRPRSTRTSRPAAPSATPPSGTRSASARRGRSWSRSTPPATWTRPSRCSSAPARRSTLARLPEHEPARRGHAGHRRARRTRRT